MSKKNPTMTRSEANDEAAHRIADGYLDMLTTVRSVNVRSFPQRFGAYAQHRVGAAIIAIEGRHAYEAWTLRTTHRAVEKRSATIIARARAIPRGCYVRSRR